MITQIIHLVIQEISLFITYTLPLQCGEWISGIKRHPNKLEVRLERHTRSYLVFPCRRLEQSHRSNCAASSDLATMCTYEGISLINPGWIADNKHSSHLVHWGLKINNSQVQIHVENHFLRSEIADTLNVDAEVQLRSRICDKSISKTINDWKHNETTNVKIAALLGGNGLLRHLSLQFIHSPSGSTIDHK